MKDIYDRLHYTLEDLNIWGLEIKSETPTIVVEGKREALMWILKELFDWDRDVDYITHTINYFEIVVDFEQNYIVFFLKPENHA